MIIIFAVEAKHILRSVLELDEKYIATVVISRDLEGATMIKGLQHISMIVSSEKSVAFYEMLGFREKFRKERGYDTVVALEGFDIKLLLFVDPKHPARATDPENIGFRNLVLHVDNLEITIEEIKKVAEESNLHVEFGPILKDWHDSRLVFLKDPDGLPIGLHE